MASRRGNRRPRIDKWDFWAEGKHYEVSVYFQFKGLYDHDGFVAVVPADGRDLRGDIKEFKSKDLAELHSKVEAYITGMKEIEWEDWLEIITDKPSVYGDTILKAGVNFHVSTYQQGKDEKGNYYCRLSPRGSVRKGKHDSDWRGERGATICHLPDTPENRQTLKMFCKELNDLAKRIHKFMSPRRIKKTLAKAKGKLLTYSGEDMFK
jgi:hypothetical protein